jgi:hypothetical protein
MFLVSTQPLTEVSTSKGGRFLGLRTLPLTVLKSGSLNLLEPFGPVEACVWIALPFTNPKTYLESNKSVRPVLVRKENFSLPNSHFIN